MGQMISFARSGGGGTAQGYFAESKNAKGPGIVVIQEWWGLQGQIKAVCDNLAQSGFNALAPDLYNGKVGLTGFCMGGAVTVIGAATIPELDAAVTYYGLPPPNVASGKDVRVPIQGHFANQDDWVTKDKVDQFEKELKAAGKTCEIYRYDAHHAFLNSDRKEVYNPQAAKQAWDRGLAWFRKHLGT